MTKAIRTAALYLSVFILTPHFLWVDNSSSFALSHLDLEQQNSIVSQSGKHIHQTQLIPFFLALESWSLSSCQSFYWLCFEVQSHLILRLRSPRPGLTWLCVVSATWDRPSAELGQVEGVGKGRLVLLLRTYLSLSPFPLPRTGCRIHYAHFRIPDEVSNFLIGKVEVIPGRSKSLWSDLRPLKFTFS